MIYVLVCLKRVVGLKQLGNVTSSSQHDLIYTSRMSTDERTNVIHLYVFNQLMKALWFMYHGTFPLTATWALWWQFSWLSSFHVNFRIIPYGRPQWIFNELNSLTQAKPINQLLHRSIVTGTTSGDYCDTRCLNHKFYDTEMGSGENRTSIALIVRKL